MAFLPPYGNIPSFLKSLQQALGGLDLRFKSEIHLLGACTIMCIDWILALVLERKSHFSVEAGGER